MEILKFKLEGATAFFRNNDFNDGNIQYSYGHIHKTALLGLLGAILGLTGHNTGFSKKGSKYTHPEFYNYLKELEVGIRPNGKQGSFIRKKQNFINGCGYIKKGDTLMYTEQWIYNVSWDIYINLDTLNDDILKAKLKDYVLNNKAVYMPYLGKTNHSAIIKEVTLLEGNQISNGENIKIDSLFKVDLDNIKADINIDPFNLSEEEMFEYREVLPYSYSDSSCIYKKCLFAYSNKNFNVNIDNINILNIGERNIYMF